MTSTLPKEQVTLPPLTEDQQQILRKVWTGTGPDRIRQAAIVLAREFAIQPWQVRAWATHMGLVQPQTDLQMAAYYKETIGVDITTTPPPPPPPAAPKTKICNSCHKNKPVSEFRASLRQPDGLTKLCAACIDSRLNSESRRDLPPARTAQITVVESVTTPPPAVVVTAPPTIATTQLEYEETVAVGDADGYYQMLYDLVYRLPMSGRWTMRERERWMRACEALVDLLVLVTEEEAH